MPNIYIVRLYTLTIDITIRAHINDIEIDGCYVHGLYYSTSVTHTDYNKIQSIKI